ncbi:hypothetical protein [Pseudactinotalea sp. HY158]|uniref:hypothetical protein n=1 Tax=Pseudactinotalea sp. HY158 TaxID=2654547 RepID=UPI001891F68E|nr:hypothetical protein [Pseudactinotalea sp. HY158]
MRQRWDEVLQTLAQIKRVTWALVSQNAQVVDLSDDSLTLGFATGGLATAFRSGTHSEPVAQALAETLGLRVRIEVSILGEDGGSGGGPRGGQGGPGRGGGPGRQGGQGGQGGQGSQGGQGGTGGAGGQGGAHSGARGPGGVSASQRGGSDAVSRASADWGLDDAPVETAEFATERAPAPDTGTPGTAAPDTGTPDTGAPAAAVGPVAAPVPGGAETGPNHVTVTPPADTYASPAPGAQAQASPTDSATPTYPTNPTNSAGPAGPADPAGQSTTAGESSSAGPSTSASPPWAPGGAGSVVSPPSPVSPMSPPSPPSPASVPGPASAAEPPERAAARARPPAERRQPVQSAPADDMWDAAPPWDDDAYDTRPGSNGHGGDQLVGAPLVAKLLGGTVIDEVTLDSEG